MTRSISRSETATASPSRTPIPTRPGVELCYTNDFETGTLAPFVPSHPALVAIQSSVANAVDARLIPQATEHMAVLTAGAPGVYTTLSLSVTAYDVTTIAYDVRWVGMDAAEFANDDASVVSATLESPSSTVQTLFNASIGELGDFVASPWQRRQHTIAQPGVHTLQFRVRNAVDSQAPSMLLVDAVSVCVAPPSMTRTGSASTTPSASQTGTLSATSTFSQSSTASGSYSGTAMPTASQTRTAAFAAGAGAGECVAVTTAGQTVSSLAQTFGFVFSDTSLAAVVRSDPRHR